MKTLFIAALLITTGLCSCNNSNTKEKEKVADKDTSTTTLVNLASTNTMAELLSQNWENKEDVDDQVLSGGGSDLEIPFHSYSFFDDGAVVQNPRDNMKIGKWKLDEKTKQVSIVFEDGAKKSLQVKAIGIKSLLLKTEVPEPVKFISDGKKHSVLTDDPFYPSNNKWRIKPARSENDDAIKERVIQAVLFYSKFFKDNADRKLPAISFYGLPSCFKWYSGGISITNKEKLPQKWIDCFYNKDEAIKGQQMLENIISKKYKWNKNETRWVKQSADVLLQMADSLK